MTKLWTCKCKSLQSETKKYLESRANSKTIENPKSTHRDQAKLEAWVWSSRAALLLLLRLGLSAGATKRSNGCQAEPWFRTCHPWTFTVIARYAARGDAAYCLLKQSKQVLLLRPAQLCKSVQRGIDLHLCRMCASSSFDYSCTKYMVWLQANARQACAYMGVLVYMSHLKEECITVEVSYSAEDGRFSQQSVYCSPYAWFLISWETYADMVVLCCSCFICYKKQHRVHMATSSRVILLAQVDTRSQSLSRSREPREHQWVFVFESCTISGSRLKHVKPCYSGMWPGHVKAM